jgi:hypothetical protein
MAAVLLGVATAVLVATLATRNQFLVGAAGVLALATGWTALRLAWNAVANGRYEHAADRTELARAYHSLFAQRSVEHAEFARTMEVRLAQRDRVIHDLKGVIVRIEMRAVEAESSAQAFQGRLHVAQDQLAAMGDLITAQLEQQEASRRQDEQRRARQPLLGDRGAPLRDEVVPEWAELEPDPLSALMAWEKHADHVAGRHAADERRTGGA